MSKFTTKPPLHPILVTLGKDIPGQVDIWLQNFDGRRYRVLAMGNGKLHLPQFDTEVAKLLGLKLNGDARPVITLM